MTLPIRPAVRILLLNDTDELLLARADDPTTTGMDGKERGAFWFTIGGGIEGSESLLEAAAREAQKPNLQVVCVYSAST